MKLQVIYYLSKEQRGKSHPTGFLSSSSSFSLTIWMVLVVHYCMSTLTNLSIHNIFFLISHTATNNRTVEQNSEHFGLCKLVFWGSRYPSKVGPFGADDKCSERETIYLSRWFLSRRKYLFCSQPKTKKKPYICMKKLAIQRGSGNNHRFLHQLSYKCKQATRIPY